MFGTDSVRTRPGVTMKSDNSDLILSKLEEQKYDQFKQRFDSIMHQDSVTKFPKKYFFLLFIVALGIINMFHTTLLVDIVVSEDFVKSYGAIFFWLGLFKRKSVPIFFLNLAKSKERRSYMEKQLSGLKLNYRRIEAYTYHDKKIRIIHDLISSQSKNAPNNNEIACIASHMIALYEAVNDNWFHPGSPYAVILEDDVHFEFKIKLEQVIAQAPNNFSVLQLMTSNSEQVNSLYKKYVTEVEDKSNEFKSTQSMSEELKTEVLNTFKHQTLWEPRTINSNLWSTQAYVVRKAAVRDVVNAMVSYHDGLYTVMLINSPTHMKTCKPQATNCMRFYPYRLVADTYLYDVLGLTYTSRLPLLNGGNSEGYKSTIHGDKNIVADESFKQIDKVVQEVKFNADWLLPSGVKLKS